MARKNLSVVCILLGVLAFFAVLSGDQLTKQMVREVLSEGEVIPVLPFFDITFVWNRGISFGLFSNTEIIDARQIIIVVSVCVVLLLVYWLVKSQSAVLSIGLGLMIGGAMGNIIDRWVFGAVVDFIHVFWGSYSWYVFNVADIGVSLGIGCMLLDNFVFSVQDEREDLP